MAKRFPFTQWVVDFRKSLSLRQRQLSLVVVWCVLKNLSCHLHPEMQRKLIRYLSDRTTNQYFVSSHSSHFIDMEEVALFHVTNDGVRSVVSSVRTAAEARQVCVDLGYRASDLLQANCVVFVEGPSDRVYLNHWIGSFDRELVEGIHYTILPYGGGTLFDTLRADETGGEFANLGTINRNLVLVCDSDKVEQDGEVEKYKMRVAQEIEAVGGYAWITEGQGNRKLRGARSLSEVCSTSSSRCGGTKWYWAFRTSM